MNTVPPKPSGPQTRNIAPEMQNKLTFYLGCIDRSMAEIQVQLELIKGWQAMIDANLEEGPPAPGYFAPERVQPDAAADSRRDSMTPHVDGTFTY